MPNVTTDESPQGAADLRKLVLTAFEMARAKGAADWRRMNTAVLKNRLLQTTGGRFSEITWGFRSMRDLVASMPDLLDVDPEHRSTFRLRADVETVSEATLETLGPRVRIRDDLWDGVMDYRASGGWAWSDGRAVPAEQAGPNPVLLPTISADDMSHWRAKFISSPSLTNGLAAAELDRLRVWEQLGGSTQALPASLRGPWNAYLKRSALDRLIAWFTAINEVPPADLLGAAQVKPQRSHAQQQPDRSLRSFVLDCVAAMTEAELTSLNIPAGAALRATLPRSQG